MIEENKKMKVAVIGIGNMGQALIEGFIKKGAHRPDEIYLYDYEIQKATLFAEKTGCHACSSSAEAATGANVVLIAVKPQVIGPVLETLKEHLGADTLFISIAAGVSIHTLREMIHSETIPLIRVMPNTPALVGEGASALCFSNVPSDLETYAMRLFETGGIAVRVEEKVMDAVTGLSGSGPAYGMIFIEAMADAGVKLGLARDVAVRLAAMTLKGSAAMVLETGKNPAELKNQVCSPGGTTISGVYALEKAGFRSAVMDAVCAAAMRSKELSEESGRKK